MALPVAAAARRAGRARLHFRARVPILGFSLILGFNNMEGTRILTYHMALHHGPRRDLGRAGEYSLDLRIDALSLGPGLYNIVVVCRSGDLHFLDFVAGCTQMEVVAGPTTPAAMAHGSPGGTSRRKMVLGIDATAQPACAIMIV